MRANQDSQNENAETGRHKRGEMIAVVSAKGGVGRTMLAVNLAAALVKKNIQISLLDGDYQFGDVSLAMDLQTTFTVKDVIEDIDGLDEYGIASYLNKHESGVKVLAAPDRPEYADLITNEAVDKIINLMLVQQDYLVVDTEVGMTDRSLHLIERADQILVVTNLEMATLKNTKLLLETMDMLGLRDRIQVVINRATMESVIKATDVPGILGENNPIYIPNDFQVVSQSVNIGMPFVLNQGKTEVAKSIFKMAEQLSSRREISMFRPKKQSIFSKLFSKSDHVGENS